MAWIISHSDDKCKIYKNEKTGLTYSVGGNPPLALVLKAAEKKGRTEEAAIIKEIMADGFK